MPEWVVVLALALAAQAASAQVRTLYVDPAGSDRSPGSAEQPLATVAKALALLRSSRAPAEIVLAGGVYPALRVGDRGEQAGPPRARLVLRAARRPDGRFEDVRFDAGAYVAVAEPVADAAPVHRVSARWKSNDVPQMWETDSRTRYSLAADLEAVKRYPASFTVSPEGDFLFHTSDGQPPTRHEVGYSWQQSGILVWRSDVTLQGLQVRDATRAGIVVRGQRVFVEDCRVSNSRQGVSVQGDASAVRRLRVDDSGGGVYVNSADASVEDARLFKRHDRFAWLIDHQDDSGVQFYYPAKRGLARGNLSVGFKNCVFVKTNGGARIEHNTCVNTGAGAFGVGGGWEFPETAVRNNVVVGFTWPVAQYQSVRAGTVVEGNCLWENRDASVLKKTLAQLERVRAGRRNLEADPRFAAPESEDYRLMGGPCAARAPEPAAGAFPALPPGELPGRRLGVAVTLAAPARLEREVLDVHAEHDPRLGGAPARLAPDQLPALAEWLTPVPEVTLLIATTASGGVHGRLRIGMCGEPEREEPARERTTVRLPADRPDCLVRVRMGGEDGGWSEPAVLLVRHAAGGPRIRSGPDVRASRHGAVVTLETDGPATLRLAIDGPATVTASSQRAWIARAEDLAPEDLAARRLVHQVVVSPAGAAGRHRYRISLTDALGRETQTEWAPLVMDGPARTYFVDPAGQDAEARGGAEAPWRTLQFALDRALPGDGIVLAPGLYPGETIVTHGGSEKAPITVEASVPGTAVLDGAQRVPVCLELKDAPYVSFDGLEVRWATETMIRATDSPGLVIRNSRIWGALWFGSVFIGSIELRESPGARLERNVIFQSRGPFLRGSPRTTLVHNTLFSTSLSAVTFLRSARGSVCRNNSLAFNGNEIFNFGVDSFDEFAELDSDYNNLGSHLQPPKETWIAKDPSVPARVQGRRNLPPAYGRFGGVAAKRLVYVNGGQKVLFSLEEWQAFSGKDTHSLFADPRYVDVERRDFRLKPGSPNLGAGEGGSTIGALGVRVVP